MYRVNDDNSIYVTRGDIVLMSVSADKNGEPYTFQAGEVLRIKVYGKKDAENVVLQKDFPITAAAQTVTLFLSEEDTKIGEVISKPKDYWYEVELNPYDNPQTIIGYDEDGAKLFKLFPEGDDIPEYVPDPEVIKVIDTELDMTSERPVQNQVIARAIANLQGGYQAIHDAIADKYVTPQMYGAIGDGVADDTKAIQLALDGGGTVYFPAGVYRINGTNAGWGHIHEGGIRPKSNTSLVFAPGAVLKCLPNDNGFYNVIALYRVENVTISGGKIIGDVDEHTGTGGEFGFGVGIYECNGILIEDMEISKCWGDGIVLDSHDELTGENNDIVVRNCVIHDCRRQGISVVIGGKHNEITGCHIYNISGTAPQSGIDIEPNNENPITDLLITGCTIHDTVGASIILNRADGCRVVGCKLDSINCWLSCVTPNIVEGCVIGLVTVFGQELQCSNSHINCVSFQGGSASFTGCKFTENGDSIILAGNDGEGTGKYARFTGCVFEGDTKPIVYMQNGTRLAETLFEGCDFRNISKAFTLSFAETRFSGCNFHLTVALWSLFTITTTDDGTLFVMDCCRFVHEGGTKSITYIVNAGGGGMPNFILRNNYLLGYANGGYTSNAEGTGNFITIGNITDSTQNAFLMLGGKYTSTNKNNIVLA